MAYPDLHKQSIYFEILSLNSDGTPGSIVESFAFTIPPSNLEIVQPQRVTKTQTPGGYFVDNYGLDGAQITISGETGNEESRLTIIGPKKTQTELTGQEAYFKFRDTIVYYSEKNQNYTMRFYDLTNKRAVNNTLGNTFNRIVQLSEAWEVVLDESALRKSSAKPFFYPYTINLTGIRRLGTFIPGAAKTEVGAISETKNIIQLASDALLAFQNGMDSLAGEFFEFLEPMSDLTRSIDTLKNQIIYFENSVIEYEQKLGGIFEDVVSSTTSIITEGIQLIKFPYDILETARQEYLTVESKTIDLIELIRSVDGKDIIDYYDFEEWFTPSQKLSIFLESLGQPISKMVVTAKQGAAYEPIGAVSINGVVVPIYGFTTITIKENTRLDILARDLFGDPEFKDVISALNGTYSIDELVVGDVLTIPLLTPDVRYATNAVYTVPEGI